MTRHLRMIQYVARLLCAVLLCLLPMRASAQTATATLSGTVVDQSSAVLPATALTLVNADTAVERTATAGRQGGFTFPFLPPGRYLLRAQRDGFAPAQFENVVLNVGDDVSLLVTLRVGNVTDAVSVVADARPLSQSGTVGTTVDRRLVENLPLNGRSFQSLITLVPGTVPTVSNVVTQGQFSVNGQRASSNYFTIDGVSANFGLAQSVNLYEGGGGSAPAVSAQGSTSGLVSADAVEELTIQTSTFAPEFGRSPGAQVSIVTRSGTNQYRGSAFNYFRSDALDATDWFVARNNVRRAEMRQNDFGFTIGGPVLVPSLYDGHHRTFFFASYEGLRLVQPRISNPMAVPSLAARQAATGLAREILNAYPEPNRDVLPNDPDTALFVGSYSDRSTLDATSVRLDHSIADLSLFGRWHVAPSRIIGRNPSSPAVVDTTIQNTVTATLGATFNLSPRWLNDVRVNYSRARADLSNYTDDFAGAIPMSAAAAASPAYAPDQQHSRIAIGGSSTIIFGTNQNNRQRQWNIVNVLSTTQGNHSLKFGLDYRRLRPIIDVPPFRRLLNFATVGQVLAETATVIWVRTDYQLRPEFNNYSLFAQDTWRPSSRATMTYGLRWDVNPSPSDASDHLFPTVTGLDSIGSARLAPEGTRFYDTTYRNFAPRVGASYTLSQQHGTVLRGGAGVYYDLGYLFAGSVPPDAFPFGNFVVADNVPFGSPAFSGTIPASSLTPPYGTLFAYEDGYALPYALQYNVGIDHQVSSHGEVSATYVGAIGRRLPRVEVLQNPGAGLPGDFTRVNLVRNAATSDYHSLQLQYRRRLAGGLQGVASYTLARSMDIVSDESIINYQAPLDRYDAALDRGPSQFDVRHAFSGVLTYDLPSPRRSGSLAALLGGFGVDVTARAQSATPVAILTNTDSIGVGTASVSRPNTVPGVDMVLDDPTAPGGRRFNPAAFTVPPQGQQGTLGRNALRGFGFSQVDVSLRRHLALGNRTRVQLRLDAFNVFNRANFANPEGRLNNVNFGRSTSLVNNALGGLTPQYQIGGPRSLQLSLKLLF